MLQIYHWMNYESSISSFSEDGEVKGCYMNKPEYSQEEMSKIVDKGDISSDDSGLALDSGST